MGWLLLAGAAALAEPSLQFHWHTPSQHTINGEYFPLEMHLVHQQDGGSLADVGVLIRDGTFNRSLAEVSEQVFPSHGVTEGVGSIDGWQEASGRHI
jgi:carbonic anhydrase